MKNLYILVLFSIIISNQAYTQEQKPTVTGQFIDMHLKSFIAEIYDQTGIRIFYKPNLDDKVVVNVNADSIPVEELLTSVFTPHNQNLSWWHGNIIISENKIDFAEIPDFKLKSDPLAYTDEESSSLSAAESRYLTGRRADVMESITIGSAGSVGASGKARVRGRLRDADSGEPLIGATMFIQETGFGAASDANGFISFSIEPGTYISKFDCLGQKSTTCQLVVHSNGEFTVNLEKSLLQLDEVFVYANRSMNILTRETGLERIPVSTIRELPTMMGERDVIRVSEYLPGIVSIGEGTSGINVRGGNFDQNGFYINKIPIYNTSHVFGFFPAFNPDIVRDFSIYKGHIPAEHGGRLSSVFNILTHQGNRKHFNLKGGVNPISTNITFEGPIVKDKGSFLFSLRSSYSDWILKRIEDPIIRNSNAKFSDFAFSANYSPTSKSQLNLFTYYSTDYFKLSDINQYNYHNAGASIDWRYALSPSTYTETSLIASQYGFETIDQNVTSLAYKHNYLIGHYEAKSSVSHIVNQKNKVEFGVSAIGYELDRGTVNPYGDESLRNYIPLGFERAFDGSVFAANTYDPLHWLNLYLGVRYNFFAPLGEAVVYNYMENAPRDQRYISDTLSFNRLKPIKWYHGPEIRASLGVMINSDLSVKLAYNQTRQNLFMLNNTITISPNSQWKLADYHLKPALGDQLTFGIYHLIPDYTIELSAEIFRKKTKNLTEFKDGANFTSASEIETMVLQGEQSAYGLELMLKKTSGRLNGWVAYTYSNTSIQIDGENEWEKINNGMPYPSNYDIPHVVNMVANYRYSRRISFSSTCTYQTGRPITYPLAIYYYEGIPVVDYSNRNEFRIPGYFRMDFSLTFEGNLKREKLFHSSWMFGVYNLTGRKNPLSIYFKSEDGRIKGFKYSIIGTPIFTVTWLFKLGNYAS